MKNFILHLKNGNLIAAGETALAADFAGLIMMWGGASAPTGWFICDGSAVSRTTYATLFGLIGTTFGGGDGTTTFNLPDMRGRVPVGKSSDTEFDVLGETGGEKTHVLTVAELAAHRHDVISSDTSGSSPIYGVKPETQGSVNGTSSGANKIANTGSDAAHNNLQPYITINFIIKS